MAEHEATEGKFHALLIGIDNYSPGRELKGCVNDIDLVQKLLLGKRVGLAKDRIRRLASPRPRTPHARSVPGKPATLANIRAALAELGSNKVAPGDRVFIYYSGHGTRVEVAGSDGCKAYREALVPVDYDAGPDKQFLFDFEINKLLRRITARTKSVTAVIDCCYAAGTTRAAALSGALRPRFLELDPLPAGARSLRAALPAAISDDGDRSEPQDRLGSVDDCHVVCACLNHQVAKEDIHASPRNGLLTRAFVEALESVPRTDLRTVTWAQVWQTIQARVRDRDPEQHPWMAGNPRRQVLAGPPVDGDPGFPVRRDGDGYHIDAGELAGITAGAVLAVYGQEPRTFKPLGSQRDLRDRKGLLRVTQATDATATAVLAGQRFKIPPGARGRLVKAGAAARLPCAVVPRNAALERAIKASPLLQLVGARRARVKLERHDKRWFVTDAFHGTHDPDPILVALQPGQLGRARDVLEHYHAYSQPLRMAELINGRHGSLAEPDKRRQGGLELRVLSSPAGGVAPDKAQAPGLPPAPTDDRARYTLRSGANVCFEVHNPTAHALRVTLVNAAASGKVQLLGDQVIDAERSHLFWANEDLGTPFEMAVSGSRTTYCVDRLVAIGRTETGHALSFLKVDQTFEDVLRAARGARPILDGSATNTAALDDWAASAVVIETRP